MKLLISAPYFQLVLDRYRPLFDELGIELVVPTVHERLSEAELLEFIEDIDGVIAGDDKFTARVFEQAPKLKVLSKWGTGIDSFDADAAQKHGVTICNTPGAFNEPVADQVWGYILAFARQIPWIHQKMTAGAWEKLPGFSLQGKTLGVIGVGNTGQSVIRRAQGFEMEVLGHDIREIDADFCDEYEVSMVSKEALLENADFISLNCDLNPSSHHLIQQAEFETMPKHAVLINCARGPLIKHRDLVAALRQNQIAGAALDVFETEPLPKDDPLRFMDQVLLSPHNANSSPEHWDRVHRRTVRQALDVLGVETETIQWPSTI
ncbi:MAG: phosphoglycerate dehydrogenase [Bacteroidota bacterium]